MNYEISVITLMACISAICMETTDRETSLLRAIGKFILEWNTHDQEEPPDRAYVLLKYDFIIVGAGSAGCVLANRLTEVKEWNILLIEAGEEESYLFDIPIMAPYIHFTQANWNFKSERSNVCLSMVDQRCSVDRGKVMGGSSVINFMLYSRGNRYNYDEWEEMGHLGWGWKDVLPLFMKLENMMIPELKKDKKYHSTKGDLPISYPPFRSELADIFMQAAKELEYNDIDVNGEMQHGFSYVQTTTKNGTRYSASKAFLHPIRNRKNLHVMKRSMVTKILIDPSAKNAYGVEFVRNGNRYVVHARKEVILSAGAVNSPQLLMLSGVGQRTHLTDLGIPVIQDLNVGYNLMDHCGLLIISTINDHLSLRSRDILSSINPIMNFLAYHQGPLTSVAGTEVYAYLDSKKVNKLDNSVDIELLFTPASFQNFPFAYKSIDYTDKFRSLYLKPIEGKHSWNGMGVIMQPKSRGRITLKSRNPFHKPSIYHDFYKNPEDMETLLRAIKLIIDLGNTTAFQKLGSRLYDIPVPGCEHLKFGSDEYWRCAARHVSFCIYHGSGTCKMGPPSDSTAVVDSRLRVHGMKRLRVVDASIIPKIPSAHINVITMMIGENAAKFIKEDWNT